MIEQICIHKGPWIVKRGKHEGESMSGPAFNETVYMLDMKVSMEHEFFILAGYTGTKDNPHWYGKEHFEILISDETLAKELEAVDFSQTR